MGSQKGVLEDLQTSSSPMWPMISLSIFRRSAASTSKPVAGVVVDGSGNQVLYLWAKERALKRAAFRPGLKALYLWYGQFLLSDLGKARSLLLNVRIRRGKLPWVQEAV